MKIGLFFGSFNPIHIGHLMVANGILEETSLDKVTFMVSPQNPDKEITELLEETLRFNLIKMSIIDMGFKDITVSDFEFFLPRPSYTEDTLKSLLEKHPNHEYSIIVGSDVINTMETWRGYEYIIENFDIYVYPRLGYEINLNDEFKSKAKKIEIVNLHSMEISSSLIRQKLKDKKSISLYTTRLAEGYIKEKKLYY